MKIEEAKFILNNVEIEIPSTRSQAYFDTDEINLAIETTVQSLEEREKQIEKLEENLKEILEEVKKLNTSQREQEGIFIKIKNTLKSINPGNSKYKTLKSF
ncbi:MAG: hypothetical protein J6J60_06825 [Clostridia bacterium]|nr:hypothetical protein [Clostridia bacterium]